jgi:hypothetical protein
MSASLAAALAGPSAARAQEVNLASLDDAPANRVYVRAGAEHAFVAAVGYARAVRWPGRCVLLSGELAAPWAGLDASDFRLRAGLLVPVAALGRWRLAGTVSPTLRGTENELGRMTSLGADLGAAAGHYAARWFLAAEVGFDWALATHVAHGALYRQAVHADARDGWYSSPGGNFRLGLQAGASFGPVDLALRAGQHRDVGGAAPLLPFYGTLALGARW